MRGSIFCILTEDSMKKVTSITWDSDNTIEDIDNLSQREARAQVFKLKKWIRSIELQPNITNEMQKRLVIYKADLNSLQLKRMTFNGKRIL